MKIRKSHNFQIFHILNSHSCISNEFFLNFKSFILCEFHFAQTIMFGDNGVVITEKY